MSDLSAMRRIGEIHIQRARAHALRLHMATTAVFPNEWMGPVTEDITLELMEFAFHARRVNDICGFKHHSFSSVKRLNVTISEGDPSHWQERYQDALNALHHAISLVFGNAHSDHRVLFPSSAANLIPTYVKIQTDHRASVTVSLAGVAYCFLNEVIPLVRDRHADWKF